MDKILIVTVGINHLSYIKKLLNSLYLTHAKVPDILYIDNNSIDGTLDYINSEYPEIITISNSKKSNYSVNFNIGLDYAVKNDYEFVIVLNPDIIFIENTIEKLYRLMIENKTYGVISGLLIYPDGSLQYNSRRYPNLLDLMSSRLLGHSKLLRIFLRNFYNLKYVQIQHETDWLIGAFLFINVDSLKNLYKTDNEYFDSKYKLYFEDVDLCYRLKMNGWKIVYTPITKIIHNHQRESTKNFQKLLYHINSYFLYSSKRKAFKNGKRG